MSDNREIKKSDVTTEDGLNFMSATSHSPRQIDQLFEQLATVLETTAKEYHTATAGMDLLHFPGRELIRSLEGVSEIRAKLKTAFLENSSTLAWRLQKLEDTASRPASRAKAKASAAPSDDPAPRG